MPTIAAEKVTSIRETPAVKAALAALAPVAAHEQEVRQRLQQHLRVLNSFTAIHEERHITDDERLVADAEVAGLRVELARTVVERRRLEGNVERALDAAREAAFRAFDKPLQQALSELDAALLFAKGKSDAVMKVQFERHEATNRPFDSLHWQEFAQRYPEWREAVRSYGFDLD
jgi:hypothetical protein